MFELSDEIDPDTLIEAPLMEPPAVILPPTFASSSQWKLPFDLSNKNHKKIGEKNIVTKNKVEDPMTAITIKKFTSKNLKLLHLLHL